MNGINKQLATLGGIPAVIRGALAFQNSALVSEMILAVPEGEQRRYRELCGGYPLTKLKAVTAGGATRFLSVKNALQQVSEECGYIAVHDGARPLITTMDIDRVLKLAKEYGAAIAAAPVTDTIKQCRTVSGKNGGNGCIIGGNGCIIESTPDRSRLFAAQTPQAFRKSLYLSCMERLGIRAEELTDDSALLELCGEPVRIVPVTACNMKITRPQDIAIAEAVLSGTTEE